MGAELFPLYPGLVKKADDILGYSLEELCLEDPDNLLGSAEYCQPALFVVNGLMFLHKRRREKWPDFIAGHSLGEFSALFAAGAFDFETGLSMVKERARCMATAGTGSMLAVIGPKISILEEMILDLDLKGLDVANYNLPTQTVLSGPDTEIIRIDEEIQRRDMGRSVHLHVGGAFHSRYAKSAAAAFQQALKQFELNDPFLSVISSVTARPYKKGEIRNLLEQQILKPVRWVETMLYLHQQGTGDAQQIGPGRVLDGLWERFVPDEVAAENLHQGGI